MLDGGGHRRRASLILARATASTKIAHASVTRRRRVSFVCASTIVGARVLRHNICASITMAEREISIVLLSAASSRHFVYCQLARDFNL